MKYQKQHHSGFTLIETMIGVLIFSIVIIGGFQAYNGVLVGKIKLIKSTDIQKESFYFSEKFFEEIKKGGTIDFEEYFNRTVVNGTDISIYGSGHYSKLTGFGNFGSGGALETTTTYGDEFYYCRSSNGSTMAEEGCVLNNNIYGIPVLGKPQRYGQYSFQFLDYNSNGDNDLGDEDGDGNIRGDEDDDYLGDGPAAFSGSRVDEIYLISADKKKRTLFRWSVKEDPNKPSTVGICSGDSATNIWTGGCLGTIEYLKLEGRDWGLDHNIGVIDTMGTQYDGLIDTWIISKDFGGGNTVAGSDNKNYWQPLFSEDVNVSDVLFHVFPNKDVNLAWRDSGDKTNVAPYIRLQMTLSPSYKAQRGIKGKIPKIKINTTITLTDIYSR